MRTPKSVFKSKARRSHASAASSTATPVSAASATSGKSSGGGVTSDGNVRFKTEKTKCKVVVVDNEMCRAFIGKSSAVCTRLGDCCHVASHKDDAKRLELNEGSVLMIQKNSTAVYQQQSLPTKYLEQDVVLGILTRAEKSIEDWQELFFSIRLFYDEADKPANVEDFNEIVGNIEEGRGFVRLPVPPKPTPRRKIFDENADSFTFVEDPDGNEGYQELAELVPTLVDKDGNPVPVEERVTELETYVNSVADAVNENFEYSTSVTQTLSRVMNSVMTSVGVRPNEIAEGYKLENLWSTVGALASHAASKDTWGSKISALQLIVEGVMKEPKVSPTTYKEQYQKHDDQIQDILEGLEIDFGTRLQEVEEQLGVSSTTSTADVPKEDPSNELKATILALTKRIEALEREKDGKVVHFGNLHWTGLDDALAFLTEYPELVQGFGLFVTFHFVCVLVNIAMLGDNKHEQRVTNLAKNKLGSTRNAQAISAYYSPIPQLYSSETVVEELCNTKSVFDKYPHADKFSDLHIRRLDATADKVLTNYTKNINNTLKPDSKPHTLCMLALSTSVAAFKSFNSFIISQYRTFVNRGISTKKAWALTTRLGQTILEELYEAHGDIHNEHDIDRLNLTAAQQLYASACTMDKLKEFTQASFERHASIGNTITNFGLEPDDRKSDMSEVDRKLKELKKQLQDDIPKKKDTDGYQKQFTTVNNRVNEVEKKLKDLVHKDFLKQELSKYKLE